MWHRAVWAALVCVIAIGDWTGNQVMGFHSVEKADPGLMMNSMRILVVSPSNYPCREINEPLRIDTELFPKQDHLVRDAREQRDAVNLAVEATSTDWKYRVIRDHPWDDFSRNRYIQSRRFAPIGELKLERTIWRISYEAHTQPWPLVIQHNVSLVRGVEVSDDNRSHANESSHQQGRNLRYLKPEFALIFGALFIFGAFKFLVYALKRDDYFIVVGIFGSFIPGLIGFFLILYCFLASPPPIFGFTVLHLPLPWID
jgi:hypothetical protein